MFVKSPRTGYIFPLLLSLFQRTASFHYVSPATAERRSPPGVLRLSSSGVQVTASSRGVIPTKKIISPASVIHIHHSCNCTKQTTPCVGVASRAIRDARRGGRDAASRVAMRRKVVAMATPAEKHSQQRNGINSLADNARRCFEWENKCVCTTTTTSDVAGEREGSAEHQLYAPVETMDGL